LSDVCEYQLAETADMSVPKTNFRLNPSSDRAFSPGRLVVTLQVPKAQPATPVSSATKPTVPQRPSLPHSPEVQPPSNIPLHKSMSANQEAAADAQIEYREMPSSATDSRHLNLAVSNMKRAAASRLEPKLSAKRPKTGRSYFKGNSKQCSPARHP
jgi:hypothetical protein